MLELQPISLKKANAYVAIYHRHHKATRGHKFSLAAYEGGTLVGVAICGRPVSRHLDDGKTLEVNRLCTDGTKNVCSFLYSASARVAKEMGYERIITYILQSESGVSLKASGFTCDGDAGGPEWTGERKPKDPELYPHEMKTRWSKELQKRGKTK